MVAFKPKAKTQSNIAEQRQAVQTQPSDLVVVARIGAAYGVKGWVKLHPFSNSPDALHHAKTWWITPYLGTESSDTQTNALTWSVFSPLTFKAHADAWVAQCREWTDRSDAEKHKGWQVAVSRADFPQPDEDEFYWVDLVGAQVINQDGVCLGVIDSLLENTAQTVMSISSPENKAAPQYLIPFVSAFVGEVDLQSTPKTVQVIWDVDATA
ncbi:ribosome maturation factor RimM [Hydromonas duriensis]|uniref:Ribosome maturation factor RimM n=1 Tax=Hydromonas duriensis TaxID=1527608 RepID=A0A4R6YBW4_9BURK|nr:ribosome maturation factor RimM [Hydromonas duriensis]TDR33166.1 16S rRNA processing protein RimM [Hydromonas duriensis]